MANTFGNLGYQGIQAGQNQYQPSFIPMNQQMAAMGLGNQTAGMAQTGQLTGTGYAAQLGTAATQTAVNSDKAASELYGNLFSSMMSGGGGGGLFDTIGGTVASWFD